MLAAEQALGRSRGGWTTKIHALTGVTTLSMAPSKLRGVRAALALHSRAQCEVLAHAALGAFDAGQARECVLDLADPDLAGLAG